MPQWPRGVLDHIMRALIIGGGDVGFALAKALAPRHDVFVVDHDPGVGELFGTLDVELVTGSATSESVLRRAGIEQADLLVACTGLDEVNVVACSIANGLGHPETICFVSKDDFLRPLGDGNGLREHFGINRVIWPEAQLADDIERIIAAPGAIDAEAFAGGAVRLLEYRLEAGSPLTAGRIAELGLPPGALIVAVKSGDRFTIPRGDTRLQPGDKIVVMGTREAMQQVQGRMVGGGAAPARRLVTIVGGGDVGFRLARHLDDQRGIELRVIERDADRGALIASQLSRALVLNGDGTDLELLESEQIGRSHVLVSVIDNDERNLLASLIGRQLGVRTIITRVSRPANLRLFERVGIDVAISARSAAVAAVVHQVDGGAANLLAVLEEGQARVLEIAVPADFVPTALRHLQSPPQSIVGAILRGDTAHVPRGDDLIQPGDRLIVFAATASVEQVRDYFAVAGR